MGHTWFVSRYPDPAELYPDVAAAGSLAAALQLIAAERGLDLGQVAAGEQQPLNHASISCRVAGRKALRVNSGAVERVWMISGWSQGISLVSGSTHELAEVARAAALWRSGVPLGELAAAVPFVELGYLALASEQGPEQVVTAQWGWMFEETRAYGWPEYEALLEAACAEPQFRQLYPYSSHWTLRFSTTTGYPFSPDYVALDAWPGKPFVVKAHWWDGPVLGETATAEEAIALAVTRLPADVGPAVAGPYSD